MDQANEAREQALKELSIEETHRLEPVVEQKVNELTRELLEANREPLKPSKSQEPYMYYKPGEGAGGLPAVVCTCGWSKKHLRMKILQRASEKHFLKTGHRPRRGEM